ncbi:MAG: hypothetical protein U0354_05195 [Candidatus Sericytochromatia bacterium]
MKKFIILSLILFYGCGVREGEQINFIPDSFGQPSNSIYTNPNNPTITTGSTNNDTSKTSITGVNAGTTPIPTSTAGSVSNVVYQNPVASTPTPSPTVTVSPTITPVPSPTGTSTVISNGSGTSSGTSTGSGSTLASATPIPTSAAPLVGQIGG